MYLRFFGFREAPFNPTPDPRFLYLTPSHREALAQLVYGVQERKGFVVLTGEVGTGKTTLVRALMRRLEGQTTVAFVANATLPFDELLAYILEDLGIGKDHTLFAKATGQSEEKIAKDIDRDYWLGAEDAVSYGLVNRIVESQSEID